MGRILKIILLAVLGFLVLFFGYFFVGSAEPAKEMNWGVNFSQKQAELLGLNWKENYLAIFNDLGAKKIRLAAYWDLIEAREGEYNFEDLDWQIGIAQERGTELILVIGMKTPRWPECHIPEWAKGLSKKEQQKKILEMIEMIVERYRERVSVWAWQVENEPFFPFGECPKIEKDFVKKEIALVRSLDPQGRPVIITDSGEWSFWITAARLGDMVGITTYREVEIKGVGIRYPLPPVFYHRKAEIIRKVFNKEPIGVELQVEPWGIERGQIMTLAQFKSNIEFARRTGLNKFYLWGAEWMYWMKEEQGQPEIWQEAKKLF